MTSSYDDILKNVIILSYEKLLWIVDRFYQRG